MEASSSSSPPPSQLPTMEASSILFQVFNWESFKREGGWYNFLISTIPELAASEITHVWLPSSSQSAPSQVTTSCSMIILIKAKFQRKRIKYVKNIGEDSKTKFDKRTKEILQAALEGEQLWRLKDSNGKPPGLIGLNPEKAVTFIDKHDTGGSTQNHRPFSPDKVMQGYVYILTHPGIPSIFSDHFFDWDMKEAISKLMVIRKRNGIKATSTVRILASDADLYVAAIDEKIIAKIGPRFYVGNLVPITFKIAISGHNYAVWQKQ